MLRSLGNVSPPKKASKDWACVAVTVATVITAEWVHRSVRDQVMQEWTCSSVGSIAADANVVTVLNTSASSVILKMWWPALWRALWYLLCSWVHDNNLYSVACKCFRFQRKAAPVYCQVLESLPFIILGQFDSRRCLTFHRYVPYSTSEERIFCFFWSKASKVKSVVTVADWNR